jgi:RHS repeat-associated protein
MEQDNEVQGQGNAYDFGARIYDSRLGRWMSTDPQFKKRPDQSTYKSFLNNPIIYVDPDGETEWIKTTVTDEATGESFIHLAKVSEKYEEKIHSVDAGYGSHSTVKVHEYYNIYHEQTVTIKKDGSVELDVKGSSLSKKPAYTRHPLTTAIPHLPSLEGDGGTQSGGVRVSSKNGGVSPSKFTVKRDGMAAAVDGFKYEEVIGAMTIGLKGKTVGNPSSSLMNLAARISSLSNKNAEDNLEKEPTASENTSLIVTLKTYFKSPTIGGGEGQYPMKDSSVNPKDLNKIEQRRIVNVKK